MSGSVGMLSTTYVYKSLVFKCCLGCGYKQGRFVCARDKQLVRPFAVSSFAVHSNDLSAPRSGAFTGPARDSRQAGVIDASTCPPVCQGSLSHKVASDYLSQ